MDVKENEEERKQTKEALDKISYKWKGIPSYKKTRIFTTGRNPLLCETRIYRRPRKEKVILYKTDREVYDFYQEELCDLLSNLAVTCGCEELKLTIDDIVPSLIKFFVTLSPSSPRKLRNIHQAIAYGLQAVYKFNMYTNPAFSDVHRTFMEKVAPVENINLYDEPIDQLYASYTASKPSPQILLHKVAFEMFIYFGEISERMGITRAQWKKNTFNIFYDKETNKKYISFCRPVQLKCKNGALDNVPRLYECGGETCPVKSFRKLVNKLPQEETPLICQLSSKGRCTNVTMTNADLAQLFQKQCPRIPLKGARYFSSVLFFLKIQTCPPFPGFESMPDRVKSIARISIFDFTHNNEQRETLKKPALIAE